MQKETENIYLNDLFNSVDEELHDNVNFQLTWACHHCLLPIQKIEQWFLQHDPYFRRKQYYILEDIWKKDVEEETGASTILKITDVNGF